MIAQLNIKNQIRRFFETPNIHEAKQYFLICFITLQVALIGFISPLYSTPDVTFVGLLEPKGGIGKIPITIIETLGDKVSANFILTNSDHLNDEVPASVTKVLNNPDLSPGKVGLLTDVLGHLGNVNSHMPKECIVKLAYSMLETTRISNLWVNNLNEKYDAVIVPDKFLLSVYKESGVRIPVLYCPCL